MQQEPNYGRPEEVREPGYSGGGMGSPVGMSAQDERQWSMLAHLSILVGLIGLIPFGALIIWLVYKDKSSRVRFHALQSLWYQIAWIGIFIAYFFVTFILSFVTLGIAAIVLVPLGLLLVLVPFVHQCYAAYKVNQGIDYRYPVIADMVDRGRFSGISHNRDYSNTSSYHYSPDSTTGTFSDSSSSSNSGFDWSGGSGGSSDSSGSSGGGGDSGGSSNQ